MHELEVLVGHQFSLLTFSTPSYLEKHEISMMMPFCSKSPSGASGPQTRGGECRRLARSAVPQRYSDRPVRRPQAFAGSET